ncbi:MAG: LysR family transcriptional regulator [Lachnospiraceae bacterium]|nr:LysR family transcriptional regulator [Lachnospiraceae bacterium]
MTFLQVRYFVEVSMRKSMTRAAEYLYVSEQAVSKQLKSLEREMGFPLIYMNKRQLELTAAGEILFQIWEPMLKRMDTALLRIRQENDRRESILRLGALEYENVVNKLMPVLAEYAKEHSEHQIEIMTGSPRQLFEYAHSGEIDLMLTFSTELPDIVSREDVYAVRDMQLAVILPGKHPLADKENFSFQELREENFFILERNHSMTAQDEVSLHCRLMGFEPKMKTFNSPESIEVSLMHNNGVSVGFMELFHNHSGRLKMLPIEYPKHVKPTQLVFVSLDQRNTPEAKRLAEMLRTEM